MSKKLQIVSVKVKDIKPNPSNPRSIRDDKFKKLVRSIIDFPEMLEARPVILNKEMVILGGNMRFNASIEADLTEIPAIIVNWSKKKQEEFIIKDNVSGGEWNWEMLANEWNAEELDAWGLDVPKFDTDADEPENKETDGGQFYLNVKCDSEGHCQSLYEKLTADGLDVKIIT